MTIPLERIVYMYVCVDGYSMVQCGRATKYVSSVILSNMKIYLKLLLIILCSVAHSAYIVASIITITIAIYVAVVPIIAATIYPKS